MCECLDYEDGDRYQCVMCADMDREREAENARLREALRDGANRAETLGYTGIAEFLRAALEPVR